MGWCIMMDIKTGAIDVLGDEDDIAEGNKQLSAMGYLPELITEKEVSVDDAGR